MYKKYDSILFDLDGTLWDARETYAKAWNDVLNSLNINRTITIELLSETMGLESEKALEKLIPEVPKKLRIEVYHKVTSRINVLIPIIGGKMYSEVNTVIPLLSEKYKLLLVSNCPKGLIENFLEWAKLEAYFLDKICYGDNYYPKSKNIRILIEKHKLLSPIYIGDTDSDSQQCELINIPFGFIKYGFGNTKHYTHKFSDFSELFYFFR
ncbi:MAG: HAD hydrolase-like protein [Flavobacteriaceae bacterium]|jgi:phosphoglycolate phosphatase|nr:HAD hydrolase-like protein [Flavobacteriaceae bacterium]